VVPEDEMEQLLDEVAEIKNFIFCRLLLAQSALLPAALQSNSIDEFLGKGDVTREHLRDLCLKLERPKVQDVRDACTDFLRERDALVEPDVTTDPAVDAENMPPYDKGRMQKKGFLPDMDHTKRELAAKQVLIRQAVAPNLLGKHGMPNNEEDTSLKVKIRVDTPASRY
jgi:hypothetical protein